MAITGSDMARAAYECRRAAANDDRAAHLIRADVTLSFDGAVYEFPAVGASVQAICESAEELAGGRPFGLTVLVLQ